jgi:hypothetical protein
MNEYAFDVKLLAVCRVKAETEEQAREKMFNEVCMIEVGFDENDVKITEASLDVEEESTLFQINRKDV